MTPDRAPVGVGIVHLGLGHFHRAHQAMYVDRLLALGGSDGWGICGVGTQPGDAPLIAALDAQDGRYTLVLRSPDGSLEASDIRSIVERIDGVADPEAVVDRIAAPTTHIVSLTITEGGYGEAGHRVFDLVARGLQRRRDAGLAACTVLSCDNIEGNGQVAERATVEAAARLEPALAHWVEANVAFPSSMVDRITPATTDADRRLVAERWGPDAAPVVAEPFAQWVLEDAFSDGRPRFEDVGVQVVDDVRPYELMKLRLLNGGHQALAHLGALLGHHHVHEAATDPLLAAFLRRWWAEALPTLAPVPGIDLDEYTDTLLERFANPGIADTVARLCAFTSDRIPTWVFPVAGENLAAGRDASTAAAMTAAWVRYLEVAHEVVDRRREALVGALPDLDAALVAAGAADLAADERFAGPCRAFLDALRAEGPTAALVLLLAT